ncbi:MAG: hypothetical protein L0Z55_01595, partial [Planctomycetes bacterium]|nr:hypothetical protein [Planctomycetota bacterium]
ILQDSIGSDILVKDHFGIDARSRENGVAQEGCRGWIDARRIHNAVHCDRRPREIDRLAGDKLREVDTDDVAIAGEVYRLLDRHEFQAHVMNAVSHVYNWDSALLCIAAADQDEETHQSRCRDQHEPHGNISFRRSIDPRW